MQGGETCVVQASGKGAETVVRASGKGAETVVDTLLAASVVSFQAYEVRPLKVSS